jgi:AcrR family transcriptional regulator
VCQEDSEMPEVRLKKKNKHQVRTEETQAKILDAAEVIFSERGFENTQLEEVAARAGYTRGAIYANYADKEDLFLALMKHRVLTHLTAILQAIEAEPQIRKRPGIFKKWIASHADDRNWSTLVLEFKLYAVRRPRSRAKLLNVYDTMRKLSGDNFIGTLFGDKLEKRARAAAERRLAVVGAILGAVILESHLQPKLLPKPQLQRVLEDLFDALIRA